MTRHPFLERTVSELTRLTDSLGGGGVLVALSGGSDSVALLLSACAWRDATGRPVAAAHLNHQLRGPDADTDAAFCRDLCARLAVPLHLRRADPRPLARTRGRGLEEAGRTLRHTFFAEVLAADPDLVAVATGHHRDDQIETVLLRLWRGCGLDGLAGLRPVAGTVIHPLLAEDRATIVAFLADAVQPWREDATNGADEATRNRLRRELLPLVRDIFGQGAAAAPARLADLATADLALLDELTDTALADCDAGGGALGVRSLLAQPLALQRRVLRRWLDRSCGLATDLEANHVEVLRHWLREGRSGQGLDLPGGIRVVREFDRLVPGGTEAAAGNVPRGEASDFRVRIAPVLASAGRPPGPEIGPDGGRLACPASALRGSLRVANWQPGDTIALFGLGGRKKLSDLFQEKQIPVALRPSWLTVRDDAGILWLVGLAQSERTRVLPTTDQVVTILLQRRSASAGAQHR